MSYAEFEMNGIEIFDADEFRQKVCSRCKFKPVCEQWEFDYGATLFHNIISTTKEPLKSFSGKLGVYRCSCYLPKEDESSSDPFALSDEEAEVIMKSIGY